MVEIDEAVDAVVDAAERLRARVAELEGELSLAYNNPDVVRRQGAAAERAAIVDFLKREGDGVSVSSAAITKLARQIEGGSHLRGRSEL